MLKKLFKYDLRSIWRYFWIILVTVPALSLIASLLFRHALSLDTEKTAAKLVFGIEMFVFVISLIAVIGSVVVTEVLLLIRFYKNLYSDEGYLTFTLPVSRKDILLAKTLNALVWSFAHAALIVVCTMIFLLICPTPPSYSDAFISLLAFEIISFVMKTIWSSIGAWTLLYAFEALVLIAVTIFFNISLWQLAITVGSIVAKKAKVLAGIGICYAVSMALGILFEIISTLLLVFGVGAIDKYAAEMTKNEICAVLAMVAFLVCCFFAMISFLFHFITLNQMENNLNLP